MGELGGCGLGWNGVLLLRHGISMRSVVSVEDMTRRARESSIAGLMVDCWVSNPYNPGNPKINDRSGCLAAD